MVVRKTLKERTPERMKALADSRTILAGGILFALMAFAGCQGNSDAGGYQEYSTDGGIEEKLQADHLAAQTDRSQPKTIRPAVAEKRFQPAVAEASDSRPANTEIASSDGNPMAVLPGQPLPIDNSAAEPREIKLLVPEKRFPKASADGTLRVTYDDLDLLKVLNMEPVPLDVLDYLPDWMEQLDGKRIRIRGFMMPEFQAEGLRGFILARDNEICCYGRAAKVYDLIGVRMAEGTTTKYLPRTPFDVEGIFQIVPPEPEDDVLLRLYEIHDAKVITGRSR